MNNLARNLVGKRPRLSLRCLTAFSMASIFAMMSMAPTAEAFERHVIEIHHGYPRGYRPIIVPAHRFYRGIPVVRFYGPRYPGFGFYYNDAAAFTFLGLTAWQLSLYADMNEAQLRAHEAALAQATTAPINDDIVWNDAGATGDVKAIREGHTADGRECREFQQIVTIAGRTEDAYGTACKQTDGSWKIAESPTH